MPDHTPDIWRDWDKGLEPLDLTAASMSSSDVVEKVIGGEHHNVEFHRNFLRSVFRDAVLDNVDFSRADSKDSSFVDSEFVDTNLSDSSTVSCTFSRCTFIRCSFEDSAFHECSYQECTFIECDFKSSMLRNSLIDACRFENCTTSNKLFEGCRLFSNRFEGTVLDFAAILDNFGLDSIQIDPSQIRANRTYPKSVPFSFEGNLHSDDLSARPSPFERLKLQFYLSGGDLVGSDTVDEAFEPTSWLAQVRAPVNLARLLQDFGDFLLRLYGQDRIAAIFVLKLASLANSIWQGFTAKPEHALLSQAGAGMYLQCVRELADLDSVIAKWLADNEPKTVTLRSFDDAADESIASLAQQLAVAFPQSEIQISPRNSPVNLIIGNLSYGTAVTLLTLFFGTKTKMELVKLRVTANGQEVSQSLFAVAIGGAKEESLSQALSLSAAMPGALVLRIDVGYSSALVERLRKIIKQAL